MGELSRFMNLKDFRYLINTFKYGISEKDWEVLEKDPALVEYIGNSFLRCEIGDETYIIKINANVRNSEIKLKKLS